MSWRAASPGRRAAAMARRPESESAVAASCVLHKRHSPAHLTLEFHHVVPVAWQLLWQPPKPWPFPGNDPDGRGALWDSRGLDICPTGHRNVHAWIVRMMREVTLTLGREHASFDPEDALLVVSAARKKYGKSATASNEFQTATLALIRWREGGGSLQELVRHDEWGES